MDRGVWWATFRRVTKSEIQLSGYMRAHTHTHTHTLTHILEIKQTRITERKIKTFKNMN